MQVNSPTPLQWNDKTEAVARRAARFWAKKYRVNRQDWEDVEQDVALLAFEKISQGKLHYQEGLWLMARNLVIDRVNSRQPLLSEVDPDTMPVEINPDDQLLVEQISQEFPELVAIAEARASGLEWSVIAEAFGVTSACLRVRWGRLTKRARERFGDLHCLVK